ncbi:early nodulin-like protein 3 [Andrographis paniculata]|uniref:early nodulin-like protein 3 n=1 Tax=Andrographis paniculata TaxID=175694 RepID=UPI0021E925FC|nr:early nodulin-like protein 3 [Andrographis paniculata]
MARTSLSREASGTRFLAAIAFLLTAVSRGEGFQFQVGGSKGTWAVPTDPNTPIYNQWAEKTRFQIGDSILFVYDGNHDSVLHVTKDAYTSCSTDGPVLDKFSDGHSVYKFDQSGPHYFISGVAENCHKNEKMVIVVMADRGKSKTSNETAPAPSPHKNPNETAPAPSPHLSPPAPAPQVSPPSPAPETSSTPAPAPSGESAPPKNEGSGSVANGIVGMVIASFIGVLVL